MQEISTQIDIDASASIVWGILTDFGAYRRWNPLIASILGFARRGHTIMLIQKRGSLHAGRETTVIRHVAHVREPYELQWRGNWAHQWVFASERRFRIESLPEGRVRFHQSERFDGIAATFLWRGLQRKLMAGFGAMNRALKERAERTEADFAAMQAQRVTDWSPSEALHILS
jgi:hypothetical protein